MRRTQQQQQQQQFGDIDGIDEESSCQIHRLNGRARCLCGHWLTFAFTAWIRSDPIRIRYDVDDNNKIFNGSTFDDDDNVIVRQ